MAGGGVLPMTASCPHPGRNLPPPSVQLLDAARSLTRPPPPSPATELPQQLGKARGEQSPGFGALGSPAAKGKGSETHLRGLRAPGNWRQVLGRGAGHGFNAEPRKGSWPGAGAGGRRGTPRRALQGAARPARLDSALFARPRALTRLLASAGSARARRGARCAVLSAPGSAGIHRPAGRRQEGRRRGKGEGARARLRVSARVSQGRCARGGPGPGSRTKVSPRCLVLSSGPLAAALPPSGPGAVSLPARPYGLCV